jgi:L-xylulose reductase
MDLNFSNRRILVTGAGKGIGRQLCQVLVKKTTATVFALSQTQENLTTLKKECPNIKTICVDVNDWAATRKAVQAVLPIDGLVNNAAVAHLAPFLEVKPEEIDASFSVNVKAVINVSQVVAQSMKATSKGGSIVNISSQASQAALTDHTVYCGTKGALDMVSKVMALELGPFNIRVNCINPTVVMTEMGKIGWSEPTKAANMKAKIPMGKFAEVEDVIHPILFLLSDKSDMINGITLPVDGGFLAC